MKKILNKILLNLDKEFPIELGKLLFTMESQFGFPPEMTIEELGDRVPKDIDNFFLMAHSYLCRSTEHKISSGLEFDGETHNKIRKNNLRILNNILEGNLTLF